MPKPIVSCWMVKRQSLFSLTHPTTSLLYFYSAQVFRTKLHARYPAEVDYVMASGMRSEFEGGAEAADPAGSVARVPVAPRPDNRSDGFSWRLAAFYAAFFGFSGIIMPFFPAWLQAKGPSDNS
jgi:hypothetical protein